MCLHWFLFLCDINKDVRSKSEILETIKSKDRGQSIHVKTKEYSYWGCFYEHKDKKIILNPYYTNKEKQLPIHNEPKEFLIEEITDVD